MREAECMRAVTRMHTKIVEIAATVTIHSHVEWFVAVAPRAVALAGPF
jgi:hypothetical protein